MDPATLIRTEQTEGRQRKDPNRKSILPPKLNLGCGRDKIPGFVNVDAVPDFDPDLVHDLNRALPFDTKSVREIYLSHCLEHVVEWHQLLEECYRVLAPMGKIDIRVPDMEWAIRQYITGEIDEKLWYGCEYSGRRIPMTWHALLYGGLADTRRGFPHVYAFSCMTGRDNDLAAILTKIGFMFVQERKDRFDWEIRVQAVRLA